ncbi:membrane protein [Mycobacterium antarcticum]|nr:membrane protein [Mycolicibacterium sp. TUM20985]GLP74699.1 membrane protein [Mycolicibacterium sp. TUM20983]GLP80495.1 membrane protein [Mycolicibacterium sp. TUM20984]
MSEPVTPQPAGPDPWKSFRGVMAGTLILEAIVVLLALPVVSVSQGGLTWVSGGFLIGITGVLILLAGVQGKPWALKANLAVQVVLIGGVVISGAIAFIGVVFAAVWGLIAYLRAEVKRRQDRGLLPGQQPPPTDG